MKINKLASYIANSEGKKSQASIGDIREILSILSDVLVSRSSASTIRELHKNGRRRMARRLLQERRKK
jgi:hypothetical protein